MIFYAVLALCIQPSMRELPPTYIISPSKTLLLKSTRMMSFLISLSLLPKKIPHRIFLQWLITHKCRDLIEVEDGIADEIIVAEGVMVEDTHRTAKFVANLVIEHKNAERDLTETSTVGKIPRRLMVNLVPRRIHNQVHMPIIYLYRQRQDHLTTLSGIQTAEQLTMSQTILNH